MKRLNVALTAVVLAMIMAHVPAYASGDGENGFGVVRSAKLAKMYSGKTWIWSNGGGYFAPDHRFIAWTGAKSSGSYARGTWSVRDGRVCTQANWVSKAGSSPARVCFLHRLNKHIMYQRKVPGGKWYIFRHARLLKSDEAAKFVRGDLASRHVRRIRAALGKKP